MLLRARVGLIATLSTLSLTMSLTPASVYAQDTLDAQLSRPRLSPKGVFSAEGAATLRHVSLGAGLILNYANNLVLFEPRGPGDAIEIVDDLAAHAMLSVGLWDRAQLDVSIPVYVLNRGDTSAVFNGAARSAV